MNELIRDARFDRQPEDRDAFIVTLMDLFEDWMAMYFRRELSAKQIEQYNKLARNNQDTTAFLQSCVPDFNDRVGEQLAAFRNDFIAQVDQRRI